MRAPRHSSRRSATREFLAAAVLVLAFPAAGTATVGDPGETYPVRFKVRVSAIFDGDREDRDTEEQHNERWTKREKDVLSFDGVDTFHWETPLRNGVPLAGWYVADPDGSVRLLADLGPHHVIRQYRFPWIRVRGCLLREAGRLKFSKDGSKVRGTRTYHVEREEGDDIEGTVWIKYRGKRL
jgi:hypothetical protein